MQLSEFGKFIRTYRINHTLLLKDMANKLGVTSAFLSAVETNKKPIPQDFHEKLVSAYEFSAKEKSDLFNSIDLSKNQEIITMPNNNDDRFLIGAFCRNFESLDHDKKAKILNLLEE